MDFNKLTWKEKTFMIVNIDIFPLSLKCNINFYRNSWMNEINDYHYEEEKNTLDKLLFEFNRAFKKIIIYLKKEYVDKVGEFHRWFSHDSQYGTKEDIKEILRSVCFILHNYHMFYIPDGHVNEYIDCIFNLISYRMQGFLICKKLNDNSNLIDSDNDIQVYLDTQEKLILDTLFFDKEYDGEKKKCYFLTLIYVLYILIGYPESKTECHSFLSSILSHYYFYTNSVEKMVDETSDSFMRMKTGELNVMNVIDRLETECPTTKNKKLFDIFISKSKDDINRYHSKMRINNYPPILIGSMNSDEISMKTLIEEINILNDEKTLLDCLCSAGLLSKPTDCLIVGLSIPEDNLCYIKKYCKNVHLSKVMFERGYMFTLCEVDNIFYLLFKIGEGPNDIEQGERIFGISFPPASDGTRKALQLDVRNDVSYKLEV